MNKIYKVIWNKTRGMYMVVSELAKGQSKDGRRAVGRKKVTQTAAALALFFSVVSAGGTAWAADTTTVTAKDGTEQTVYTQEGTNSQIKAGDEKLDTRITNVKEYLEKQTSENYVSKADAAVQDAGVVKANKKIGENVTALGKGLYDETAARIGADAAQDKVIQAVNENLVQSVTTINKNVADGFTALNQADANEAAAREAKDNELNKRITNEANEIHKTTNQMQSDLNTETAAREAGDTALNTRITNVKEYLEKQTSATYVSKADAAVQDGAIVKANKTIGENVTNLDAALASETAARIGADKAQDKVIQTVNDNLVQSVNTINQNMSAGFNALSQADANELAGRVAADTELAKAVNNGLSLDKDNVLQKNTTSVREDGTVTTSKEAATTLVMNKDGNNQITLSENGIKVGLNSTVQDANGFYAGGDTAAAAKAALNADGSIKGADGKFTVDTAGNVTSTGTVQGTTLTDGKGASMSNGVVTGKTLTDGTASLSGGNLTGAHNVTADGTITGATLTDGKATISNGNIKTNGGFIQTGGGNVNTQGGEVRTNGGKVATSGGEINTGSGAIKTVGGDILTAGGKLNTSGGDIAAGTGNISGQNITASGVLSGDSLTVAKGMTGHSLTLTGGDLDAGAGTIKTTGATETGTLKTTGKAEIGGDLSVAGNTEMKGNLDVKGDLSVEGEFNAKTLSSKLDENNYTTINGGKTQSMNLKMNAATGETQASASTFDETGSNMWAKDDDSIGKSTVTADSISQKLSNIGDNPTAYAERAMSQGTDNKYSMTDTVKDGDKTNVASQSVTESSDVITEGSGDSAKTSTFRQKIDQILQEIKTSDEIYSKIDQTVNKMNSTVRDGANSTSVEQGTQDITHTAEQGTISNIAKDLVNTATGNMINTIGGEMKTTVTGDVTEDYKANLDTKVGGNETRTVEGTLTETVTGDVTEDYKANLSTMVGGNQTTTVTGDSSLTAENITNEAKNKITNKAIDVETDATSSIVQKVTNDAGSNTSTQLSYQTKEEMSQADGKTASYLRGAAEEKSQLIDGDKKTTIDTIAGQTNTNITDGTNTSNDLQRADQIASSVTDGTNTTVVNQNAGSFASSITDGTKANNTNSTVDKSEQLIKASDTQYSATSKTATKMEDALVSGGSVIDVIKNLDDAANPFIGSAVTDGTNSTGITQTAKDITNTAKNGTIANEAKDITNKATENMTNTVGKDLTTTVGGEMKTTVTGDVTEDYKANLSTTVGGNQTTTVTGDSSLSAKNITNTATEKLSNAAAEIENSASTSITDKVGANVERTMTTKKISESVKDGTKSNSFSKTAEKDINIITDGTNTSTLSQLADSVNTSLKNGTQSLNNTKTVTEDVTKVTDKNTGDFSSSSQKADAMTNTVKNGSKSNTVTEKAATSEQKLVSGNIIDILKDAENGYVNTTVTSSDGASSTSVKQGKKDITNTAKQGTITNEAKDLVNKAAENITNTAGNRIQDKVGTTTVTTTDGLTKLTNEAGNHKTQMDYAEVLKDLSVGGSATVAGDVTAKSYKVGDKTYIDENGINANGQKVTNVADGTIAEGSKDAVNGGQLHATNQRVSTVENRVDRVENRVDNLDNRIDKVGANAAAMANLHPMDFDEDSKVSVAAAVGNYRSETAGALGVFYRPTDRVMMNVSTSFGNGENMVGGGVSFKLGKSSKRLQQAEATNAALSKQVTNLQNRLDALLGVLNPNLSKAFPDVPANHWAYEAVSRLAGNDIIQGYEDGKYHGERTMSRYEMAEIIYNALSKGAKAEAKLVEEFRPELQAMAAQRKA